ncbi:MAG: 3-phosphoshikimate 1-carboxyvinyltransferase [Deltaproteobacteria bacterium]|nr:3-phosphoshikimate 1-carboxyvinyltransferase [Deltaproteobacteria bacterium]
MSVVTITPAVHGLRGTFTVPGDKSIAHRALLLGAIARGPTVVHGFASGADNRATLAACESLGVAVTARDGALHIDGRGWDGLRAPATTLDCRNSGTTMRLLAGMLAGRPFVSRLDGDASLRRRPMRRVLEPLARMGASIIAEGADGRAPLRVEGRPLRGATHVLPIASAQVKSALLLAGLQASGTTTVEEPASSRDHTERMLAEFGTRLTRGPRAVTLAGPQELRGANVRLPGDFSSAAFLIVAALLVPGSELRLTDVGVNPTRTGLLDVLAAMGASVLVEPEVGNGTEPRATLIVRSVPLRAARIGGELLLRAIDEFPILCVAAACAAGRSELRDAAELRAKESDRIAVMAETLARLGAHVEELPDGLTIEGPTRFAGGLVDSHGDHRIAMAAAIAALVATAPVTISDADCADVSFPGFYDLLAKAGGQ